MKKTLLLCALSLLLATRGASARDWTLTIRAGDHERSDSIVSFTAPDEWKGQRFTIRELGTALQVDESGRAVFVLKKLARGESLVCSLGPVLPVLGLTGIIAKKESATLALRHMALRMRGDTDNTRTIFRYQMEAGPVPEGGAADLRAWRAFASDLQSEHEAAHGRSSAGSSLASRDLVCVDGYGVRGAAS